MANTLLENVRLRMCTDADIPELSVLVLNTCRDVNDPNDFSPEGKEAFEQRASAQQMEMRSRKLKVIRHGAALGNNPELVGMSEMFVDRESSDSDAWRIQYVYVVKSALGRGIGAALLKQCLTHVAPGGVVRLRSAPLAVPFYQRFGFQISGPPTTPEVEGIRGSSLVLHIPEVASI